MTIPFTLAAVSDATHIVLLHPRSAEFAAAIGAAAPDAPLHAFDDPAAAAACLAGTGAEVLVTVAFPAEIAAEAHRLRWVQTVSAGVDPLLPHRAALRHCVVTNARGMHAEQMADYALAAMFMLRWDFKRVLRDQAARHWRRKPKAPLAGCTLGVVGLGAIGREIARRARSAGMVVIGISRGGAAVQELDEVHPYGRLRDLLPRCDFLVLAVPATPETVALLDDAALRRMKPGACLLNLARGSVVDEPALIAALREGRLGGAALDVFATEPLPADNPLWAMENVIVTPHIAGMTEDYAARFAADFAANLTRYRRGEALRNTVKLERGY
ncbi:MAG TPA: D-2-hydroxyacid dehydrogenase [Falsiroseomonas sp.]|jgi:phosphoglycerate dehydrogenase-like enzyme|nr:D-2-hydroxyacid dehydrogenase [Falsiroseomonas sp.]